MWPPEYLYGWTANLSLLGTLHRLLGSSSGGAALAKGLTLAVDLVLVVVFARAIRRPLPPVSRHRRTFTARLPQKSPLPTKGGEGEGEGGEDTDGSREREEERDSARVDWAWALGVTAVPLLSPLMEEHHLVVLLLPLAMLLLAEPQGPMRAADTVLLVGSILLLGSRYSFEQFAAFHQGPLSLLATGKLLGVAGLAWALLRRLRSWREGAP
jgi:hypothetical protein